MDYEAIIVNLLLCGWKKIDKATWKKDNIEITFDSYGYTNPLIKIKRNGTYTNHFFHYDVLKDYLDGVKPTR